MKLSKVEFARLQLDTAIDLFLEDKDFVSALTLAGAGEEITGKLLERKGEKNLLQKLHAWFQETTGETIKYGEFARRANQARNALKHTNNEEEDQLKIYRWETVQMIMRAMTNYRELVGEPSDKMKIMAGWIIKNKDKYENLE